MEGTMAEASLPFSYSIPEFLEIVQELLKETFDLSVLGLLKLFVYIL